MGTMKPIGSSLAEQGILTQQQENEGFAYETSLYDLMKINLSKVTCELLRNVNQINLFICIAMYL